MTQTPNIGLTLTPAADDQKTFLTYRTEMSGDSAGSNMVIIDTEIGNVKGRVQNSVIFSPTQPMTQSEGDVWNEELAQ
jgi:hypothetical protein